MRESRSNHRGRSDRVGRAGATVKNLVNEEAKSEEILERRQEWAFKHEDKEQSPHDGTRTIVGRI